MGTAVAADASGGSGDNDPSARPRHGRHRAARRDATAGDRLDQELVGRVLTGDAAAIGTLYDRHARTTYSLARRICGDQGMAEEVVQDVFLTLWRAPDRFDATRGRFTSWLLTLTHHKSVDAVRRATSGARRALVLGFESDERAVPPAPGADADVLDGVVAEQVRDALAQLPHEQRRAVWLLYYGGYTQREVASMTGVPLGTVKSRTFTGLRHLRRLLDIRALGSTGMLR